MLVFGCFKKYNWYLLPFKYRNFSVDPGVHFYLPNRETKKQSEYSHMQIIKALSQVITSFITQNVPGLNIRVAFKVKVLRNFFLVK